MTAPGFWMNETSGVLQPAVEAYLHGRPMTDDQVAAMRAYLRQWIEAPAWDPRSSEVERLRREVDGLTSRMAISAWLATALEVGIDPL